MNTNDTVTLSYGDSVLIEFSTPVHFRMRVTYMPRLRDSESGEMSVDKTTPTVLSHADVTDAGEFLYTRSADPTYHGINLMYEGDGYLATVDE